MSIATDVGIILASYFPNINIDEIPDNPDNAVSIFHTGGKSSEHFFGNTKPIEHPSIQIRIRHKNRQEALKICDTIKDTLDGLYNFTINNNYYILITMSSDILPLGRDNQGRVQYSLNFNIQVKRNMGQGTLPVIGDTKISEMTYIEDGIELNYSDGTKETIIFVKDIFGNIIEIKNLNKNTSININSLI